MSTFSFDDYQRAVAAAQNKSNNSRVGWFKLADDGDEALVRINISDVSEMQFAIIHQLGASTNWMKVSCINEFGNYSNNTCPLCAAAASGNNSVGKASKRVYIPMIVSYKDKATGQWSAPQAVIWDKPAGFSREIANKIRDFGDLRKTMFKVTRNGAARDMKTTYSIDYAVPAIFKPELIPEDFSAFDGFKVDKHSFWVKSIDEINTFLSTGSFPSNQQDSSSVSSVQNIGANSASTEYTQGVNSQQTNSSQQQDQVLQQDFKPQPAVEQNNSQDNFKKFSF